MDNCEYTEIFTDAGVEIREQEKNSWRPFLRQSMITSGVCYVYLLQGLFIGAPTVLIAQTRADVNATETVTDEMLSWLTTAPIISALPFVIVLPLLFNSIGRKRTFLSVWLFVLIGFIIFYKSTNLYQVLISELFAGATSASMITISPVIVAEYTSPKYRGIFLSLKGATGFWGIWISNAIGTYFHWKNIALVPFVCSIYMISMIAWPESPHWLARRGRYAECAKAHRWLKGVDESSEKELAQLILVQKQNNESQSLLASNSNESWHLPSPSTVWSIITSPPFYKPAIMGTLLITQYQFTGKAVISMYAIEVLKNLTPDKDFVYKEMLILDGVTVFSMYLGCIVTRYFKRKTLLMVFSGAGILILYVLSIYLYLASLTVIVENDVVTLLLLTVFSIAIGCGPIILCTSILGEIIPPSHQSSVMTFIGLSTMTSMSCLLKVSPLMFEYFKMHGCFLFFAICSSVILIILYIYLPETKDKTIQEIEEYFSKNQVLVEKDSIIKQEKS